MYWRCTKAVFCTRPLIEWLGDILDTRDEKNKRHSLQEIFFCFIMGFLNGKTKLHRIFRRCNNHINDLREYMLFFNGISSLSAFSRTIASIDEELLSVTLVNWIGEIVNTRGDISL